MKRPTSRGGAESDSGRGAAPEKSTDRSQDGRTRRWDEHREARRTELIDAAVLAVRDYGESVGMDQIAAVAHTSKPVIYRYFADKADLYRAIGQRMATYLGTSMAEAVAPHTDPRARFHAGVDSYLAVLDETPELYQFVINNSSSHRRGSDGKLLDNFMSMLEVFVKFEAEQVYRNNGIETDTTAPWVVGLLGFMRAIGDWWLANRSLMTRAQLAEFVTTVLWVGVSSSFTAAGVEVDLTIPDGVFGSLPRPEAEPAK